MTPELTKLRESLPSLGPIIERLELELVDDPSWGEPSDTSYLSPTDRENPDIAANIDAMAETNKLIAWFGRDSEGYLGLWRGPSGRDLASSPVVRLDTEGQYRIVAPTIADYLAIAMPEDEFASTREALTSAGFAVGFNPDAIWGAIDAIDDDPNSYRNELYEQNRVSRGLARSDADDEAEEEEEEAPANGTSLGDESAVVQPVWPEATGAAEELETAADDESDEAEDLPQTRPAQPPSSKQAPAKQAPAKQAPPKKAVAKQAAAKSAPAKRAKPAKKQAAAKSAKKPAKKQAAAKSAKKPAKKAPAKKAPAKKPAKKAKAKRR